MAVLKREGIKNFLDLYAEPSLAALYTPDMEVQVLAARDHGVKVSGTHNGKPWWGWRDPEDEDGPIWKNFRIPWKANTEPEYEDSPLTWDLAEHCEGIGMTGWDYAARVSKWVAYDYDSIVGHSEAHTAKLTTEELARVRKEACAIPWVEVRKSTSGRGLHLYVYLDDVPTANHNEHAALGRAILGMLGSLTGFDFESRVDICGGNMWVWHRKSRGTDGFKIIKPAEGKLPKVPDNWQDHLRAFKARKNATPRTLSAEELAAKEVNVKLEPEHVRLFKFLHDERRTCAWDQDLQLLSTHTIHLKEAAEALEFQGNFQTLSSGKHLDEPNCFAFPIPGGGWSVRRYSQGCNEHPSWETDAGGWTMCYLNVQTDLDQAVRIHKGQQNEKGDFVLMNLASAQAAAKELGFEFDFPEKFSDRRVVMGKHKSDNCIYVKVMADKTDVQSDNEDFLLEDRKRPPYWFKTFKVAPGNKPNPPSKYENLVRHTHRGAVGDSWFAKTEAGWKEMSLVETERFLASKAQISPGEAKLVAGDCINRTWKVTYTPFEVEYPGNREWNRSTAQYAHPILEDIDDLVYPTWWKVLDHCGKFLDQYIEEDEWCKDNRIHCGADYLFYWLAFMFQQPATRVPMLFMYGPQNSGKSTLSESMDLLMTGGVVRIDNALKSNFNGQMEEAVVCLIEETNLSSERESVYNRLKDWITGLHIPLNKKYKTEAQIKNYCHFLQTANQAEACVVDGGDTRVTVIYVSRPDEEIPKAELIEELTKEAQHFLTALCTVELPKHHGRLALPVIESSEKMNIQNLNTTQLDRYAAQEISHYDGYLLSFDEFYDKFQASLDPDSIAKYSKEYVFKHLDSSILRGYTDENKVFLLNTWWTSGEKPEKEFDIYRLVNGKKIAGRKLKSRVH